MIVETLACLVLILGVVLGLARPVVGLFRLTPAESLVAGAALSLIAAWAIAWAVFTSGAPLSAYWLVPALAFGALAIDRRSLAALARDPAARDLAGGQLLVTGWCVAWLSFVRSHSGGAWLDDWLEHWQRALYFLHQWPAHTVFISTYEMPARPPLANVLTAVFLRLTRVDYAQYQVVMATLSSLAFLPLGLLALRLGGRPAVRIAAVIAMVNPMFVENATYPWTKLNAAFFVLAGLYFFLRVRDADKPPERPGVLCALCLGGAVVTHYSAGPYVTVLAAAWIASGFARRWDRGFTRATALAAAAGACVLLPWFLWSAGEYGWRSTLLSNSSVTSLDRWGGSHLAKVLLNLRDTLVPSQVRGFSGQLMRETSPWASLRDNCFMLYQVNLPFTVGCIGLLVLLREGRRTWARARPADRVFWAWVLGGCLTLSIAVYGDRERYGIAHICMASAVLLGLAFIASRWDHLGRGWRAALVAGWAVDFALGIGLQFALEDYAIDRWLDPGRPLTEIAASYNVVAQANLTEKIIAHLAYFADILTAPPALVLALLASFLCLAIVRVRRPAPASE